ncbi:hypothetical protein IW261DRAFT_573535 [Armillaria novae-zelandiae]|uniref:Uncharacterized protein n=1 Tax=Armillaria novae-zelandiae TaxID=153914 RepID=A0AA39NZ74_9AGAR|nr:hypothetical protein IW261DRAFT_573535 [Armillaria novae-zelandiae]
MLLHISLRVMPFTSTIAICDAYSSPTTQYEYMRPAAIAESHELQRQDSHHWTEICLYDTSVNGFHTKNLKKRTVVPPS